MGRTLILKFHPGYVPSKVNAAMTAAVSGMDGVETVDMYALYPEEEQMKAAEDAEIERLYSAERLCVQFPIHWFAATPRAMAWQDLVLNRMFFTSPDEGKRLKGLPFMVAATAGMAQDTYRPGGRNLYPLEDLLRPWEVTANQCDFAYEAPFLAYGTDDYDGADRTRVADEFAARIAGWTASIDRADNRQGII
ncbi:MAG: NAD(P)H-dependent oxidoreductase [Erythrobacter sp.]|nr:MAG: NAD(P)H-dependent oxidoreductase [Erythrobacter sp.]